MTTRICVLGLGEAGAAIAADLVTAGADVHGHDPGDVVAPTGVCHHARAVDAADGAEVVLAITPASSAVAALRQVLHARLPRAIYADLSTASPRLKRNLADIAWQARLGFVDVALMAPVVRLGLATPALASGPAARGFVAAMTPLGMSVEVVGDEPGQAATRKLLRSVVMKGLAQLLLESLEAAQAAGLRDETWDSLVAQLSAIDEALLHRLVEETGRHANRRLHEMHATAELLTELGVSPIMTRATSTRLRRLA